MTTPRSSGIRRVFEEPHDEITKSTVTGQLSKIVNEIRGFL